MRSMPSTNPSRVVEALASVSLIRTTLPLVRSTSVPTDERLAAPLIKSPSQWPGTSRPSISPGRLWMLAMLQILPRGELKKELLTCFRQDKPHRGRRSNVDEKRGKICNMASIHSRPGEIEGRLVPGHWEGDLIKGAANRSSVGTLVERTSGKVVLIKLTDAKASTTRDGFVEGMLRIPAPLRLTITYDQGKEMARHRELAVATGIRVYFADPHSPWQRGSNENVNGLLRQYLPKGADLTKFAQAHLDGIAADLNSRPRKRHNYATPDEVFDALLDKAANAEHAGNGSGVSFGT